MHAAREERPVRISAEEVAVTPTSPVQGTSHPVVPTRATEHIFRQLVQRDNDSVGHRDQNRIERYAVASEGAGRTFCAIVYADMD